MSLQSVGYLGLGLGAVWLVKRIHHVYFTLTDIPTVGPSGFFGTYLAVKKYILTPEEFLAEGYRKFPNTVFKLYTQDGWTLVASGDDRLADMRKAGDDVLSFLDNVNDITQLEFTMGKEIARDMYHANVVKTTLTRNIAAKFDDVRDEINEATKDNIPPSEDWTPVSVLPTMMRIISRGANRMFLGLDFCRNEEFLQVNIDYTIGVITGAVLLRIFPEFARPILAKLFCKTEAHYRIARKHLEPMLRYRLEQEEKYGPDWEGKPNDYISWLLLIATGEQRTVRDLVFRVLGLNFAAIHTTSHSLTHALFDLAANPQYVQPLREEIESIVAEEGWSKASMQKMKRLDSFAKESQRLWGIATATSGRRIMKPFTFSNGQTVPRGYDIIVPSKAIHLDDSNYEHAKEFRPFRFSDMRSEDGEGVFHQFVTPDKAFMAFGAPGRHACPGRFFAATEIKQALSYFIINYDMKFENGERPPNFTFGPALSPHQTAQVLFRKRQ